MDIKSDERDHESATFAAVREQLEPSAAALRFEHAKTGLLQNAAQHSAQRQLVIQEQDRFGVVGAPG